MAKTLEAIRYKDGKLEILNQLVLPQITAYDCISSIHDGWKAIREMRVSRILLHYV